MHYSTTVLLRVTYIDGIRSSGRPRRHRHGHRRADPEGPLNDLSATCQRDDDVGSTSVEEAQARVPLVRSAGHMESAHTSKLAASCQSARRDAARRGASRRSTSDERGSAAHKRDSPTRTRVAPQGRVEPANLHPRLRPHPCREQPFRREPNFAEFPKAPRGAFDRRQSRSLVNYDLSTGCARKPGGSMPRRKEGQRGSTRDADASRVRF